MQSTASPLQGWPCAAGSANQRAEPTEAALPVRPVTSMPRSFPVSILPVLALLLCLLPGRGLTQSLPGILPAPAAEAPAEAAPTPGRAEAQALISVLRDDTARAALIAELERLAQGGAVPAAEAASSPAGETAGEAVNGVEDAPEATLGRRLAILTRSAIDRLGVQAITFTNGLRATWRRLSLLWGPRWPNLQAAMGELVGTLILTVGLYALLRAAVRRLYRRAAAALDGPETLSRIALFATALLLDGLAVVGAWAAGSAAVYAYETTAGGGALPLTQTLYLNAFLLVELAKVVTGMVLSPRRPALRAVPLSDQAARYWDGRLGGIVSVLGYGQMLAVPLVSQTVSIFSGRAVSVVVAGVVLLWAIALVLRHRHRPAQHLRERAEAAGGDATLRLVAALAQVWHWPALAYLLSLFVLAVSSSGNIEPLLEASARVVVVVAAGVVTAKLLSRVASRGIHLPELVREPLPLLEDRLNGFFQSLLGVMRLMIFVSAFGAVIHVTGSADVPRLLALLFGPDFGAALLSVLIIVVVAFLLWLSLASWVDYRLNPARPVPPTSREVTLLTLMRNAATIALVVFTAMASLSELGINIAPLLASAGVLGLAIGFGSQRLVQDIITGVFIQFENAINVGDVVTVGGITGSVEKLTIRSISLRDVNGVFHIVPFSSVDMVSNFMRDFSFHVAEIGIAYRESIDEAKALMFQAFDDLRAMPEFARAIIGPLDWHGVTALADSAVTLRARIRTRPGSQWAVGRAYNEAVKRRFDEAGVEIPFPHTTVWFGENKDGTAPPMRVRASVERGRRAERPLPEQPISTTPMGQDAPNEGPDER